MIFFYYYLKLNVVYILFSIIYWFSIYAHLQDGNPKSGRLIGYLLFFRRISVIRVFEPMFLQQPTQPWLKRKRCTAPVFGESLLYSDFLLAQTKPTYMPWRFHYCYNYELFLFFTGQLPKCGPDETGLHECDVPLQRTSS